jgi:8-oxo-dGTP pyrophosphatase MutT (NUDIX family)
MRGKTLAEAAGQEAYEEAGIEGEVTAEPIGAYRHSKQRFLLCGSYDVDVFVHLLAVGRELDRWPEDDERTRKWFNPAKAADLVTSDALSALIRHLPLELRATQSR